MKPFVNVLTPANSVGLISLDDAKLLLDIASGDTSQDAKLQMLIDQNSMVLATMANRDTFAREKVEEWWRCVAPVCCPDGTCEVYLTRYPVKLADIESVSTGGALVDPADYLLEENTGQLILPGGCSSEIVVVYSGGYSLPDEAPLPLQQALQLMVRKFKTEEAQAATGGSGIRLLAHKDSRIMYFSPRDMAGGGATSGGGATVSGSDAAINRLILKYTRIWI